MVLSQIHLLDRTEVGGLVITIGVLAIALNPIIQAFNAIRGKNKGVSETDFLELKSFSSQLDEKVDQMREEFRADIREVHQRVNSMPNEIIKILRDTGALKK